MRLDEPHNLPLKLTAKAVTRRAEQGPRPAGRSLTTTR